MILALGTYRTPAALLRSGIGPVEECRRHGIAQAHELPGVGRSMQNHPKISYRFRLDLPAPAPGSPWFQALLTGEVEVAGERRLYQVMPYTGVERAGHRFVDLNLQIADARSRRGEIRLQSRDPAAQPVIEMGWLAEGGDREVAVAAGRETPAVARERCAAEVLEPWPGLADPDHALRTVETYHHPVGTCRMGRPGDPAAVVDGDGRVLGFSDLFVMDASVMPRVPSANIHLAVIALAERLAAAFLAAR